VAGLTTADVKQAAQRYLDPKNYVQVVLNPESPQAPK
jgi:predicted Zn-dependent peptidase